MKLAGFILALKGNGGICSLLRLSFVSAFTHYAQREQWEVSQFAKEIYGRVLGLLFTRSFASQQSHRDLLAARCYNHHRQEKSTPEK